MVSPNSCDNERDITFNTAELLPDISDNHHAYCQKYAVTSSF